MGECKFGVSRMRLKVLFRLLTVVVVAGVILVLQGRTSAPSANAVSEAEAVAASQLPSSGDVEIDKLILEAGKKYGVDPKLIYYVIRQESNFKQRARSGKDAQGLMQIIPATAERFDIEDPYDAEQNIQGGVRYLRWLLKEFNGNVKLALAGYNAGENAVKRNGNKVPDYKETKNYVEKITTAYGKTYHPVLTPEQARTAFNMDAAATE